MDTVEEPLYRKKVGYQALLLGGFSTIATLLLVLGNLTTKDDILKRQQEDLQNSLSQVIPDSYYSNNLLDNTLQLTGDNGQAVTVYRGIKDTQINALAWEVSGIGYAGEMRFIMSVDAQGKILGVRVLSHAETPGLGDKMELAKDDWILGFNGLSLGNPTEDQWKVKKDGGQFDAFTGATITPRGIVQAILGGLKLYHHHKTELLTPPEAVSPEGEPPHES